MLLRMMGGLGSIKLIKFAELHPIFTNIDRLKTLAFTVS